jgi:phosphoglycolate phosphatase/putative hydrolase of the HAD superfamily
VAAKPLDWDSIDLVVFDVDGTLYNQRRLRFLMLKLLLADAWRTQSLDTLLTLRTFRKVREALGEQPEDNFMRVQYARTAALRGKSEAEVHTTAHEWLEQKPLPLLAGCRYPHVGTLFEALQAAGKKVATFSDYPAADKLQALGLRADPVVCATDTHIARLKPDPSGLLHILHTTGVAPARTLMIGDRFDRDGAAAQRAGVPAMIRTSRSNSQLSTFEHYDDLVFQPLLRPGAKANGPE